MAKHILLSDFEPEKVTPSIPLKPRVRPDAPVLKVHACHAGILHRVVTKQDENGEMVPEVVPVETTKEQLAEIAENFYATENAKPVYIGHPDYEGIDAPAVGWILGAEAIESDLYLYLEPLENLESWIDEGAYRYCSIFYTPGGIDRDSGEDMGAELFSLGITNQPAKDGLSDLQKSEVYFFSTIKNDGSEYLSTEKTKMEDSDIQKLAMAIWSHKLSALDSELGKAVAKLMGLPEDVSPEDLMAAVVKALEAKAAAEAEAAQEGQEEAPAAEDAPAMAEAEPKPAEEKPKGEDEEDEKEEALSALRAEVQSLKDEIKKRDLEHEIRSAGVSDSEEVDALVSIGLSNVDSMKVILRKRSVTPLSVVKNETLSSTKRNAVSARRGNKLEEDIFAALDSLKQK
jgi:hypothetical protein